VKSIFIWFLVLVSLPCLAREVPFDDVIRAPERFNRQHVTVTGLIETGGDDHVLWRDVSALKRQDLERSIHVWPDLNLPPYPDTNMSPDSPANLHWVKLTGIIDTSIHGRFGTERFGMTLEKIQILPGPRLKQFLDDSIWLKNDTRHHLKIDIHSKYGEETSEIDPGRLHYSEIPPRSNARIDLALNGKLFARLRLAPSFGPLPWRD
jgi:hypothetical protein